MSPELLKVAPELRACLDRGRPVVALESTIITHGMPYPQNAKTARAVEARVRASGATPATIALVDGCLRVGLTEEEIDRLARTQGIAKASKRDIAPLSALGLSAGTTVAATMAIAAMAGIPVFATGGIGGVHRGAETTFDISADLAELAASPVAVVCAGAKSILDLPKTLEVLETCGVPVIGYQTDDFPAFYSRSSGLPVDHRMDDPEAIARMFKLQRALGSKGGILVCNPIPEAFAIPAREIDADIEVAVDEAKSRGIRGKDVTPYLLARLAALTGGRSLAANIALVESNAELAAHIACALAE